MTLQTGRLRIMEQIRAFVAGCESVGSKPKDRAGAYAFVRRTLVRFDSARLGRADRGCVRAYIGKVCGFSPTQITRLVRQQAETGALEDRRARNSGRTFGRVCTPAETGVDETAATGDTDIRGHRQRTEYTLTRPSNHLAKQGHLTSPPPAASPVDAHFLIGRCCGAAGRFLRCLFFAARVERRGSFADGCAAGRLRPSAGECPGQEVWTLCD